MTMIRLLGILLVTWQTVHSEPYFTIEEARTLAACVPHVSQQDGITLIQAFKLKVESRLAEGANKRYVVDPDAYEAFQQLKEPRELQDLALHTQIFGLALQSLVESPQKLTQTSRAELLVSLVSHRLKAQARLREYLSYGIDPTQPLQLSSKGTKVIGEDKSAALLRRAGEIQELTLMNLSSQYNVVNRWQEKMGSDALRLVEELSSSEPDLLDKVADMLGLSQIQLLKQLSSR